MNKFLYEHVFSSLGVGLPCHVITLMFNFVRNYQIIFQSSCTILHSYQQCIVEGSFFKIFIVSLVGVKWYLVMIVICISLMTNEYNFTYILVICVSSLEKGLFRGFLHLK